MALSRGRSARALACLALLVVVACTGPETTARPGDGGPGGADTCVEVPMPGGRSGVIYAAAGPDPSNAELYEIRLGPRLCARRLTLHGRISEVTASPEMLIVAHARHLIGDRIALFRDGRFQVPGLGRGQPYGVGPSLAPDGRTLAVIRMSGPMNRIKRIAAVPMGSPGPARRLFVSRSLRQLPAPPAWGPRGQLAFAFGSRREQDLLVVDPDGRVRRIAHQPVLLRGLTWSPSRHLALYALRQRRTWILRPTGETVAEIEGWSAVT